MDSRMKQEFDNIPLAESNVSLKLADIQKRCSELIQHPDEFGGLSLEDPADEADNNNPYNRG